MSLNDSKTGGIPGNGERNPGLDRLYRTAGHEEPPARLDAAILAAARREVGSRPHSLSSGLRRWRVPVSIAAVVVLSVSLVTLVKEEGGEQLLQAPPEPAPSSPPVAQPAQPAPLLPEGALMREQVAVPAPARPARREDAGAGPPSVLGETADGNISGGSPSASQGAASGVAADTAAKPQPFRDSASMVERSTPAVPPASPADDLATRAPAVAERRAAPMAAASAPEPASAKAMMQARKEAAPGDDKQPVWHGLENEPPQKWLERISDLKRQQRAAEAEAMLVEFKRRFPGHPLPAGSQ